MRHAADMPPAWQLARPPARPQVLLLVPTAGSRLLPLVVANFPHKLRDRNTQCLYLRAVYTLAEGRAGAGIREGLLAGVLEHLISIDVEIRCAERTGEPAGCSVLCVSQQALPHVLRAALLVVLLHAVGCRPVLLMCQRPGIGRLLPCEAATHA